MTHLYPAIFKVENIGYSIEFPDFEGAFTCGDNMQECMLMAKECLELNISTCEKLPQPTKLENIKLEKGDFVVLVEANMVEFNKKYNNQTVNKTLTLPKWLNDLGKSKRINFSQLLQNALKKELNIQ